MEQQPEKPLCSVSGMRWGKKSPESCDRGGSEPLFGLVFKGAGVRAHTHTHACLQTQNSVCVFPLALLTEVGSRWHLVWAVAQGAGGDFPIWSCGTSSPLPLPIPAPAAARLRAPLPPHPHPGTAEGTASAATGCTRARGTGPSCPRAHGAALWPRSGSRGCRSIVKAEQGGGGPLSGGSGVRSRTPAPNKALLCSRRSVSRDGFLLPRFWGLLPSFRVPSCCWSIKRARS